MTQIVEFDGTRHEFPDDFTQSDISKALSSAHPAGDQQNVSMAGDVAKSVGIGLAKVPINLAGLPGDVGNLIGSGINYVGAKAGFKPVPQELSSQIGPATSADIQHSIEGGTGKFYQPQTMPGKFAETATEFAANPLSYVGPGSAALKLGGALAAGLGSEGAGQAASGSPYEGAARLGGALLGGVAGVKAFAPTIEKAAIPTVEELAAKADAGYNAARNSGVEFDPSKVAEFAAQAQQDLTTGPKYAFTGGTNGTAPKTLGLLDELQAPPEGATITAPNLDTIRRNINNIAGETKDFKPTSDAKAAMVLKRQFADYLENPPADHVVAGNAEDFSNAIKQANGDYAAMSRANTVDAKIARAQTNTEGAIATSEDNQIKSQLRTILNNPKAQRGFTSDEIDAMSGVNKGTLLSNALRQLGRGGSGVIPLGLHATTAYATGGASIPASLGIGIPLYGAKKAAEALTRNQAAKLGEMLRMRSPEYQSRLNALPPAPSTSPNQAALARALLAGITQ